MQSSQPAVRKVRDGWLVRVPREDGEVFEYHYAWEGQARFFAAVFAMGPEKLPTPMAVRGEDEGEPPGSALSSSETRSLEPQPDASAGP